MTTPNTPLKRPDPIAHLTGRGSGLLRPAHVTEPGEGGKFTPDGAAQLFPGNTFLCHIDPASAAHAALSALQARIKSGPFGGIFTYLPPPSFHMTVFEGRSPFLDGKRRPRGAPESRSRDAVTADFGRRVEQVALPPAYVIRPAGLFALHSLTVCGADAEQERSLRNTRALLRDATEHRPDGFADYVFHISLAYPLRWASDRAAREMHALSERLGAEFVAQVPRIELGPCEFCTFDTMHHFAPARILRNAATRRAR